MKSNNIKSKISIIFKKVYLRILYQLDIVLIPIAHLKNKFFLGKKSKHLLAIYDLKENACSFNFLQYIIDAEVYRIDNNLRDIYLYIVNEHREYDLAWKSFYEAYNKKTLERRANVLLPEIASLLPSVKKIKIIKKEDKLKLKINSYFSFPPTLFSFQNIRHFNSYTPKYIHDLTSNRSLPKLSIKNKDIEDINLLLEKWLKDSGSPGFITITLRESKFDQNRNSNIKALIKFKDYVSSYGIKILPLPDLENKKDSIKTDADPLLINKAIHHINIRFYLYQRSILNIFCSNGPSILCKYSREMPYLITNEFPDDSEVRQAVNQKYTFFDLKPFKPNIHKTMWSESEKQYLLNCKETFSNLKYYFDELIKIS